jgi:hypothetical protein
MVRLMRRRPTKGPATARPHLNHRATSRLYRPLYALYAFERTSWVVDGPHGAAKILALHPIRFAAE